jgi:hypothetical protein
MHVAGLDTVAATLVDRRGNVARQLSHDGGGGSSSADDEDEPWRIPSPPLYCREDVTCTTSA